MDSRPKNGTSIKRPEPLNLCKTEAGHGTSKAQENQTACKHGTLTVDGGNFSDTEVRTSSMLRTTRFLIFKVAKMLKDRT